MWFNLLVNPDSVVITYKLSFSNSLIWSQSTAGRQQLFESSDEQNNRISSKLDLMSVLLSHYLVENIYSKNNN